MRVGGAQGVVTQGVVHQRLLALSVAPLGEKILQQRGALGCQHPALNLRLVVQLRLGKQIDHRPRCAGFWICRAIHHALEPRLQHGPAAHGAGLQRDEQLAAIQPVVAQRFCSRTQGDDLGMRRGVVLLQWRIAAGGDDLAVLHHHRAHRHFARCSRRTGLRQCGGHGVLIRQEGLRRRPVQRCWVSLAGGRRAHGFSF